MRTKPVSKPLFVCTAVSMKHQFGMCVPALFHTTKLFALFMVRHCLSSIPPLFNSFFFDTDMFLA